MRPMSDDECRELFSLLSGRPKPACISCEELKATHAAAVKRVLEALEGRRKESYNDWNQPEYIMGAEGMTKAEGAIGAYDDVADIVRRDFGVEK